MEEDRGGIGAAAWLVVGVCIMGVLLLALAAAAAAAAGAGG